MLSGGGRSYGISRAVFQSARPAPPHRAKLVKQPARIGIRRRQPWEHARADARVGTGTLARPPSEARLERHEIKLVPAASPAAR